MIRTGEQYKDSIRDNHEVYVNGERVKDVTAHPQFKPLLVKALQPIDSKLQRTNARKGPRSGK